MPRKNVRIDCVMNISRAIIKSLVIAASICIVANQRAQDAQVPLPLRQQLEKVSVAMKSVRLKYGQAFADPVRGPHRGTLTNFAHFDLNHFSQRIEGMMESPGKNGETLAPYLNESAYDGEFFWSGTPKMAGAIPAALTKYLPTDTTDPQNSVIGFVSFPYLEAAGFYVPKSIGELKTFISVEPLVLHYIKDDHSPQIVNDGEHLRVLFRVTDPYLTANRRVDLTKARKILESQMLPPELIEKELSHLKFVQKQNPVRVVQVTLDPKLAYGIVDREDFTDDGKRILRIRSENWKHYPDVDLWLPQRCVTSYYLDPESRMELNRDQINSVSHELYSIEFNPKAKGNFSLDYRIPGALIKDRASEEARRSPTHQMAYFVSAHGTQLRQAATTLSDKLSRPKRVLWICIFLVLLALPASVLLKRRRKPPVT